MKNYYEAMEQDVFDNLPVTFHVKTYGDVEFTRFQNYYAKCEENIKNRNLKKK